MGRRDTDFNCCEKVIKTIEKRNLIRNGDKLVVGVSGGPDSICLLDILKNLKEKSCQRGRSFFAKINNYKTCHVPFGNFRFGSCTC